MKNAPPCCLPRSHWLGRACVSCSHPPRNRPRATSNFSPRLPLAPGERIDWARAAVTEITRLPRVGPALAQRIVAWRAEHGAFGSLERLDSVSGVGPALLKAIQPFVSFSG